MKVYDAILMVCLLVLTSNPAHAEKEIDVDARAAYGVNLFYKTCYASKLSTRMLDVIVDGKTELSPKLPRITDKATIVSVLKEKGRAWHAKVPSEAEFILTLSEKEKQCSVIIEEADHESLARMIAWILPGRDQGNKVDVLSTKKSKNESTLSLKIDSKTDLIYGPTLVRVHFKHLTKDTVRAVISLKINPEADKTFNAFSEDEFTFFLQSIMKEKRFW